MTLNEVLHCVSLGVILFYAVTSLAKPHFVAQNLDHTLNTGRGVSEFRILHGGFYLGLGLFALYANYQLVFQLWGCPWLSAAVIRIFSCEVSKMRCQME